MLDSPLIEHSPRWYMNAKRFISLADDAKRITDNARQDNLWKEAYTLVFSHLKPAVDTLGFAVDYYDPDQDYEDDVLAYVNALVEKAENLKKLLPITDD